MAKQRTHKAIVKTKCGCKLLLHHGTEQTCGEVAGTLADHLRNLPLNNGLVSVRVPAAEIEEVFIEETN